MTHRLKLMAPPLVGYLFLSLELYNFYVVWILLFLAAVITNANAMTLRGALVLTLMVGGVWLTEELLGPSEGLWQTVLQYVTLAALTAFILFVFLRRNSPRPPHSQESD